MTSRKTFSRVSCIWLRRNFSCRRRMADSERPRALPSSSRSAVVTVSLPRRRSSSVFGRVSGLAGSGRTTLPRTGRATRRAAIVFFFLARRRLAGVSTAGAPGRAGCGARIRATSRQVPQPAVRPASALPPGFDRRRALRPSARVRRRGQLLPAARRAASACSACGGFFFLPGGVPLPRRGASRLRHRGSGLRPAHGGAHRSHRPTAG